MAFTAIESLVVIKENIDIERWSPHIFIWGKKKAITIPRILWFHLENKYTHTHFFLNKWQCSSLCGGIIVFHSHLFAFIYIKKFLNEYALLWNKTKGIKRRYFLLTALYLSIIGICLKKDMFSMFRLLWLLSFSHTLV